VSGVHRVRLLLGAACVLASLALPGTALGQSTGTVSGLRAQVTRFLNAELQKDGGTVCAILNAPLNDTKHGRTCTTRWDSTLDTIGRHQLRADLAAVAGAAVTSDGIHASITLPHPLLQGHSVKSRFYWIDDCWMLTS
jgi:hypothetical protein